MTNQEIERIYQGMSPQEKAVVDAIQVANHRDEKGVVDSIISDVQERRGRFFDVIYVDLSIDRSSMPLMISGAGTGLVGLEATDNNSNCEISFELEEQDTKGRMQFRRGKGFFAPYSQFYIYHTAQSGKYIKLLRVYSTKSIVTGFQDYSGEAANSDLVIAIGNSSAITCGQVAVGTTAGGTVIKAANTSRKRIIVKCPASATVPVFIKGGNVTATDGHQLDPGDAITLNYTGAIKGIVSSGSVTVTFLEE